MKSDIGQFLAISFVIVFFIIGFAFAVSWLLGTRTITPTLGNRTFQVSSNTFKTYSCIRTHVIK